MNRMISARVQVKPKIVHHSIGDTDELALSDSCLFWGTHTYNLNPTVMNKSWDEVGLMACD